MLPGTCPDTHLYCYTCVDFSIIVYSAETQISNTAHQLHIDSRDLWSTEVVGHNLLEAARCTAVLAVWFVTDGVCNAPKSEAMT